MMRVMSACDILYFPLWRTSINGGKRIQLVRLHFIDMHERPGTLKLAARGQIHFGLNLARLSVAQTRRSESTYSTPRSPCSPCSVELTSIHNPQTKAMADVHPPLIYSG